MEKLNNNHPSLIVSDARNIVSIDIDSKDLFQSRKIGLSLLGIALIIDDYFTQFLTNFMLKSKKLSIPLKEFKNRENGEEWLLSL